MRILGQCYSCGRYRYVLVKPHELALGAALRHVPSGLCVSCERDQETERERWRRA